MRYLPTAAEHERSMLETIGAKSIGELFASIPKEIRFSGMLKIDPALSEQELLSFFRELGRANEAAGMTSFLGGGMYNHFVPSHVDQLINRSEFYTAYTPYQAEIAQGTLQTIFEFQSMICMLTGMEVSNASLYDGATSCSEALLMSHRIGRGRSKVLISGVIHPHYRDVCNTYLGQLDIEVVTVPIRSDGRTNFIAANALIDENTCGVLIQSPNFLGVIEDVAAWSEVTHRTGAMLTVCTSEPLSFGLVKPPGEFGADIVCGEGQSFGIPMQYGGPSLGLFATREKHVRQMPGRLVGRANDVDGREGYILALATREQHIRREKATSNICTNQGLCMTMATIYLATLGKQGIRQLAELNLMKAAYLRGKLATLRGVELPYEAPYFNEFVVRFHKSAGDVLGALEEKGIIGGLDLGRFSERWTNDLLVCATEMTTKAAIDRFVEELEAEL